ncbi:MAG: hypothetical protein ACP5PN_12035 [Steroidobacteraceae bacterium]
MRRVPSALKDATPGGEWMRPWIAFPAVHLQPGTEPYERIVAAWRAQMPKGLLAPPLWSVENLSGTGLFVANTIQGSGDCLNCTFFAWKPGARPRVLAEPQFPLLLCSRDGGWGRFALVLGQRAYLASGPQNDHSLDEVMRIAPWRALGWTRPCPVSIRFRYQYPVRLRSCGSNRALCRAARKVAPAIERRYHAYSIAQLDAFNAGYAIPRVAPARTAQRARACARGASAAHSRGYR